MAHLTKTTAKIILGNVSEDKSFWCNDGTILRSLTELEASLKQMSEGTFQYHVNEIKNDFSKWVNDVICDEELAKKLQKSTTPAQAAKYVGERIAQLLRQTR